MGRFEGAWSRGGRLLVLLVAVSCAPWALGAQGEAPLDADEVARRLQSWLDGTRDLQGSFKQALLSGAFGTGIEERGRVWIQRPGRMRWDYLDPEHKVAILDDDKTWLYVREEQQLILGSLEEHGSLLPTLIAAERPVLELFEADLVVSSVGEDEPYLLELRPRSDADAFESVTLALRPPEFAIESAEVMDAAGNRMLYRFSKLRRNKGVPDGLFHFDAPGGTTILGSH
jgi:outer membrane lipoprotein carrier protein